MATLFISDLHLHAGEPGITAQFLKFLSGTARQAEALYILGDLFDSWIGDDDDDVHHQSIQVALAELTNSGVPGYFMHGNRDFMIGEAFSERTGLQILPDPSRIQLYGRTILVSHGDRYCTDDLEYQAFRRQSRDPAWQAGMLALPLAQRRAIASAARAGSDAATATKSAEIMDVNRAAVTEALEDYQLDCLLHGHTHRPAVHRFQVGDATATRIVLGDWYEHASVLIWDESGYCLEREARG